jgi:hypothetical protein
MDILAESIRSELIKAVFPCDENRVKMEDFITIDGPINRAIYRDKIVQTGDFLPIFITKSRLIVQSEAILMIWVDIDHQKIRKILLILGSMPCSRIAFLVLAEVDTIACLCINR